MPAFINQEITLPIHNLGISGEGVGVHEGFTFFIADALPNETILAKVTEVRKNFGRAKLIKVLKPSPARVEPICPLFGRCGGCQIMHLHYEKQLAFKRQRVIDAFERITKYEIQIAPCIASPMPLAYRNKIQTPITGGKIGLYAKGSHEVIDVKKCYIHCHLGEKIYEWLRTFPQLASCRHLLVRSGVKTNEVLIVLVTDTPFVPEEIPSEVKGIVHASNDDKRNRVLGQTFRLLWGREWIEDILHNLRFRVSAASFFQVNPFQAENLYDQVVAFAELSKEETVLDSYCGVGTLALILAKQAKHVIGVEAISQAIKDAKYNAALNQIKNAHFICQKAEEFIPTLKEIDVAIVNPPRKGCEPKFLQTLTALRPRTIVYVSCDPATLARDARLLIDAGYSLTAVQPFDMFPQTSHVECVAQFKLLKKQK